MTSMIKSWSLCLDTGLCFSLQLEGESDLSERGADGVHTEPGGTVDIIGGNNCICALDKAKSLKGEAGLLLLPIGSDYCLTIPITPLRGQMKTHSEGKKRKYTLFHI